MEDYELFLNKAEIENRMDEEISKEGQFRGALLLATKGKLIQGYAGKESKR